MQWIEYELRWIARASNAVNPELHDAVRQAHYRTLLRRFEHFDDGDRD